MIDFSIKTLTKPNKNNILKVNSAFLNGHERHESNTIQLNLAIPMDKHDTFPHDYLVLKLENFQSKASTMSPYYWHGSKASDHGRTWRAIQDFRHKPKEKLHLSFPPRTKQPIQSLYFSCCFSSPQNVG